MKKKFGLIVNKFIETIVINWLCTWKSGFINGNLIITIVRRRVEMKSQNVVSPWAIRNHLLLILFLCFFAFSFLYLSLNLVILQFLFNLGNNLVPLSSLRVSREQMFLRSFKKNWLLRLLELKLNSFTTFISIAWLFWAESTEWKLWARLVLKGRSKSVLRVFWINHYIWTKGVVEIAIVSIWRTEAGIWNECRRLYI